MTPESIREKAFQAGINNFNDNGSDWAGYKVRDALNAALDVYAEQCGFAMGQGGAERYKQALIDIVDRSHQDPIGTSKVIAMRNIAENALKGEDQ